MKAIFGPKESNKNFKDFEKELELEIAKKDFDEDIYEEDLVFNSLLEDLNKNIYINVKTQEEEKNQMACRELLQIIKYPYCDFKPLLRPRKVSMVGRVFFNRSDNEDDKPREKA
jgi:hypothetical protein